jgi:hypothetical protein
MAAELGIKRPAVYRNLKRFGLSPGRPVVTRDRAEKFCPGCQSVLPRAAFGGNRSRPDLLAFRCRACAKAPPKLKAPRKPEAPKAPKPPNAPKAPKAARLPALGFDDQRERWLRARIAERAVPLPGSDRGERAELAEREPPGLARRCVKCERMRPLEWFPVQVNGELGRVCPDCAMAPKQPRVDRPVTREPVTVLGEPVSWRNPPVILDRWCCTDSGDGSHDNGCVFARVS